LLQAVRIFKGLPTSFMIKELVSLNLKQEDKDDLNLTLISTLICYHNNYYEYQSWPLRIEYMPWAMGRSLAFILSAIKRFFLHFIKTKECKNFVNLPDVSSEEYFSSLKTKNEPGMHPHDP
jgi:hypothetical protein